MDTNVSSSPVLEIVQGPTLSIARKCFDAGFVFLFVVVNNTWGESRTGSRQLLKLTIHGPCVLSKTIQSKAQPVNKQVCIPCMFNSIVPEE